MKTSRHRRALAAAGAVAFLALSLGAFPAQAAVPANDNFANARPVGPLPAVIAGNDADATTQGQDPASACTNSIKTTWYWMKVSHAASVLVDTHGSEHFTGVSIWSGSSLATLSEVTCSYGTSTEPTSDYFGRVTFQAKPNVRYAIRLNAGFENGGATPGGVTRLSIKTVTRPPNDDVANAKRITKLPFHSTASNVRATNQPNETRTGPCFHDRATLWYRFRPSTTMTVRADTFATNFDTVLGVLVGGPAFGDMAYLGCDDDTASGTSDAQSSVTWEALAGKIYWIQAGGYDNETGSIKLHVQRVSPPVNDDRANARIISNVNVAEFDANVSTRNATPQKGETIVSGCGDSDELFYPQSVWYRYTAPNADGIRFTVTRMGGSFPVLSLYTGNSFATEAAVACDQNGSLVFEPQAGKTYYLQVAGRKGRSGSVHLHAEPEH